MKITRRQLLVRTASAASALGASAGLYTWLVEPHWLEIVERPLPIRFLPKGLEGRTLALLTDLHVGPRVDDDYITGVFDRVAALAPDVVVISGDLISYEGSSSFERLARVLARAPRGRLASVSTLGNHDYGFGWSQPEVADRVAATVRQAGFNVLRNETMELGGLQIAGLDDLWGKRFDPMRAFETFDSRRAVIALSHNPDTVDHPGWQRFSGWILAGHTHGGQCKPPFLPPPLLPVTNRRYTSGEFEVGNGRMLYISRGVGHLTKVRFNARPEVTMFTLTANDAAVPS